MPPVRSAVSASHLASPVFRLAEVCGIDRRAEPVTLGVPVAEGAGTGGGWWLVDESGERLACQTEALAFWPTGSIQWLKVTFLVDLPANASQLFRLVPDETLTQSISNSSTCCEFGQGQLLTYRPASSPHGRLSIKLHVVGTGGRPLSAKYEPAVVESSGEIFDQYRVRGQLGNSRPVSFEATINHFREPRALRLQVTLHNPRRAEHVGGYWDLGDPESFYLRSAYVEISAAIHQDSVIRWTNDLNSAVRRSTNSPWRLIQHSSGGVNWRSSAHVDASGSVPDWPRGYCLMVGNDITTGLRATPVTCLADADTSVSVACLDFWEKFPSSIEVAGSKIRLALFPKSSSAHELQPGEQSTRVFWIRVGDGGASPLDLQWVHQPIVAHPTSRTIADSNCLEWFVETSDSSTSDEACRKRDAYLEEMLTGETNFFEKREIADEYGWRNFGDFWADHEEAFSNDPRPVISHYNNQYDLLNGLLRQFLGSGDRRWWQLARPLANHITDIDIYHTTLDRAAYNGGLFWHTAHYRHAFSSSHRTFSRAMTGGQHRVDGGGPGNEHNYTTGLLLFYLLTGDARARSAVLSLADWVVAMDDGEISLLAPLTGARTGKASSTAGTAYHGPGRGVGNSINALVDAWRLTQLSSYLEKCDELIRRCFHPDDQIAPLDLLNAELRWSYTVALQALMRYVWFVGGDPGRERTVNYARVCVSHYGRWMAAHENLYMAQRDQLEFPTETWPAQDLRKGVTLMLAAQFVTKPDQGRLSKRGAEIFEQALTQLSSYPTRHCTRPNAIVLQQFPIFEFALQGETLAAEVAAAEWFSEPRPAFVSQKQLVRSSLSSPAALASMLIRSLRPGLWKHTLPHTLLGRWWRRCRRLYREVFEPPTV